VTFWEREKEEGRLQLGGVANPKKEKNKIKRWMK